MQTIAFARGVPSADLIPVELIGNRLADALRRDPDTALAYGTGHGHPRLVSALAQRHDVDPSRIVATTGSLHAFAMIIETLCEEARAAGTTLRVAVERPTYDRPLLVLKRYGAEVVQIPTDSDGMVVTELVAEHQRRSIDLVYVIPTFQNPSGVTMSQARRAELLAFSMSALVPVMEDDPYGLLYFDEKPPVNLAPQLSSELGWFMGSFSKTLTPGLRVGYAILPESRAAIVARRANDTYISASFPAQAAVAEILSNAGELERCARSSAAELQIRCQTMRAAVAEHMPHASMSNPTGGYFLWVDTGTQTDGPTLKTATAEGVTYVPGAAFGGSPTSLRLAFSPCPPADIQLGIARLATVLTATRTH